MTWAGPRCVQKACEHLGPQNRTQGRCVCVPNYASLILILVLFQCQINIWPSCYHQERRHNTQGMQHDTFLTLNWLYWIYGFNGSFGPISWIGWFAKLALLANKVVLLTMLALLAKWLYSLLWLHWLDGLFWLNGSIGCFGSHSWFGWMVQLNRRWAPKRS